MEQIKNQPKNKNGKFTFISTTQNIQPFSFFRYIVYNPELHSPSELEMILEHEKVHARQWHSADVILVNITAIIFWFNPFIWFYRKYLIENLEFIADRATVATSVPKKAYQQALLKVSVANFQPALSNLFYQSLIKKRILMLNKKSSQKSPFWKVSAVIPLLFIFIFLFQVKTKAQVVSDIQLSDVTYSENVKISTTITKDATEKDLEDVEKMFEDQGANLEFHNIQFSADGKLVNLGISFRSQNGDQNANFSVNNSEGIPPYTLILEDGKFSIKASKEANSTHKLSNEIFDKYGKSPLFIIAGKEYKTEELAGKKVSLEGEVIVLTPEEGTAKYGDKAADGVLIISEGLITNGFENAFKRAGSKPTVKDFIVIREGRKPMFMHTESHKTKREKKEKKEVKIIKADKVTYYEDDINASENGNKTSIHRFNQDKDSPLFVINGKVQKRNFKVNSIEPDEIQSITILKDKKAIEKYGKKAKNGVIEITTKE